ncbi:hypothetical protein [Clostridium sp. 3-3]|uniref:hypothetical protein n=1 Tax=Clostridium sp. 3-3 TaxID=2070757 RepID=UPI000CDA3A08|nr:hypothetical protein [Clostridium sp. 3-3]POO87885.1 hypothetical protein C1H59_03720 [Clostridium sp. 3-3]
MIIIKSKNYKSTDDFIYDVLGEYEKCEDFDCVNIVAHYDVIIDILNQLVKTTDFELSNIRINDAEIDGYADEYIMSISDDGEIWCQEAKYDTGYVSVDDVTFVHSGCNSKFVVRNRDSEMIEFSIDDGEDFNGLQIGTTIDENGGMPGFTSTWSDDRGYSSYSFYSDDKDLVREMLDNIKSFYQNY